MHSIRSKFGLQKYRNSNITFCCVFQVPGLDVWQAALIAHAAAEQRLSGFLTQPQPQQQPQQQQQPVFRPQPQFQPQPERNTEDLQGQPLSY